MNNNCYCQGIEQSISWFVHSSALQRFIDNWSGYSDETMRTVAAWVDKVHDRDRNEQVRFGLWLSYKWERLREYSSLRSSASTISVSVRTAAKLWWPLASGSSCTTRPTGPWSSRSRVTRTRCTASLTQGMARGLRPGAPTSASSSGRPSWRASLSIRTTTPSSVSPTTRWPTRYY